MAPSFIRVWSSRSVLLLLILIVAAPTDVLGAHAPALAPAHAPALAPADPALAPADPALAPGLRADLAAGLRADPAAEPASVAPDPDRPSVLGEVAARVERLTAARLSGSGQASAGGSYSGRNHVWSPALGLDRSVSLFSCSRSQPPGMAVYRWGCAGHNNIYLFAHAGGPFRRLHDLYVRGRLRRGMTVTYADANGRTQTYAVAWWKVVLPTNGDFAFAALARPSMTLQTCVGANDRYRLVVRLLRVH